MFPVLMSGFIIWMAGCAYAGFQRRWGLAAAVTAAGIALSSVWMVLGLEARITSAHVLVAHAANLLYSCGAVATGWWAGRMARSFRARRVDPS